MALCVKKKNTLLEMQHSECKSTLLTLICLSIISGKLMQSISYLNHSEIIQPSVDPFPPLGFELCHVFLCCKRIKQMLDLILLCSFPADTAGRVRSLSTALWSLTHLTALHISDNSLSCIPPDIAKLHNLVYLDLSSNKIRSLPSELGNMVSLR